MKSLFVFLLLPVVVLAQTLDIDISKFPVLGSAHTGILVVDASAQDTLFNYQSTKLFIPASNTKLYSYYIVKKILKTDSIVGLQYRETADTLFVRFAGDPTFLNEKFEEQRAFDFLKANSKKKIAVITPQEIVKYKAGWQLSDVGEAYQPDLSMTPIYGNCAKILTKENKIIPSLLDSTSIPKRVLKHSYSKDTVEVAFKTSPDLFVKLLADTLKADVSLHPEVDLASYKKIYTHPIDSVYRTTLVESDNFLAEQLWINAQHSVETTTFDLQDIASSKVFEYFYSNFLPDKFYFVDMSGLSRYNLTSPQNTVKLLYEIERDNILFENTIHLLPEADKDGTLKEIFSDESLNFHGKSGSMSGVYCLSGYLYTCSGKMLIVSVMVNGSVAKSSGIKKEIELFFQSIAHFD